MRISRTLIERVVVFCAVAVLIPRVALAQPSPSRGGADSQVTIRSYDISDLVRSNANYPYTEASRFPNGRALSYRGEAPAPPSSRPIAGSEVPALMELIRSTVASNTWRDNGGQIGQIKALGTILVVEQTRDAHEQIQKMLDELRKIVGPMQVMTVHATWVMAQPGAIVKTTTEASDEWISRQKVVCESQITCFSGQTVHVSSGNDRLHTTDLTPVVASNAVAYDPTIFVGLFGMALQLTPQVVPGSDDAIVDVLSIMSLPGPSEPPATVVGVVQVPGGATTSQTVSNGTIDRLNIISQEMRTTARIPMKKRVIVGGMTLNPARSDDVGQLYLVLEVNAAGK
jgi:hypothetical protein